MDAREARLLETEARMQQMQADLARMHAAQQEKRAGRASSIASVEPSEPPPPPKPPTQTVSSQTDLSMLDIDELIEAWGKLDGRVQMLEEARVKEREARLRERCMELEAGLEHQQAPPPSRDRSARRQ